MPSTDVKPDIATTEAGDRALAVCVVCPHDLPSHDEIARRYCTATAAGGFHRGCVCVGGPGAHQGDDS